MKVFVSWPGYDPDDPATGKKLIDAGHELVLQPKLGKRTPDQLKHMVAECSAALVSTDLFTAEVLDATPDLRIIARVGVGVDSIDRAAADRNGVAISVTPGMNAETVADQTLAMILALVRKVREQDQSVKAGRWDRVGPLTPSELPGKSVGLVGAGMIGKAVMRRLAGFGTKLSFFDGNVDHIEGATKIASLDQLVAQSDIISLHVPFTAETRHMIDAARIARMKPGAILINAGRGGLVDEAALYDALRSGQLSGAALDVFEVEPPNAQDFADVPNLLCSAHMGGLSRESIARMTASATQSILDVLSGRVPDTVINPDALADR